MQTQTVQTYQILQNAHDSLVKEFQNLRGYCELSIPPEFKRLEGVYGSKSLVWEAFAFRADGILYGRVVLIRGVDSWINNIIIYPADGYTTPILGIELLGFRHKIHLIVADVFPLIEADEDLMDEIGAIYDDIGTTPPMPDWATKIFSRHPVFRKPRNEEDIETAARAMRDVGEMWLAQARTAQKISDLTQQQSAALKRDEYVRHHAADEPAQPFLSRCFGTETGLRLVNDFLFPSDWRKVTAYSYE
jgi:hypothetical protein